MNDACETDYQCHREIGLICDQPVGTTRKVCVCAANLYWAKDSNCGTILSSVLVPSFDLGQTTVRRIVDCTDEQHATTCLVLGTNRLYHLLTIRSGTETELTFDWFLIDNRVLFDLPQLNCALK
jgi:hypothetical protein